MGEWIAANWLTVVIVLALCGIVAAVIVSMIRKKRKGGGLTCGCGCANCPMSGSCHKK